MELCRPVPGGKYVVEQLGGRAIGARRVAAQSGGKRRVVEEPVSGFLKKAVAGHEAKNSIEGWLMGCSGAGKMFDRLWLADMDEIGNTELGDCADRATEGSADQNAGEVL